MLISSKRETLESFLTSKTGEEIALQSVQVEGRLDGLFLSTVIRQNYHNTTRKNLEIVYTFPVGWGASLLGLEVEIGNKRLKGAVIEKKEAEEKYEKAIDEGDMPVMVMESSPGLYTANLGNIKANESISVEIRTAQLLRFEQDQIRIKIPTVIAPRYGDAHQVGGLAPHEITKADLAVNYPLTISLNIIGECAMARISVPSHKTAIAATPNGVSVLLESGAMLDRDFILLLQGLTGRSFALSVPDDGQHTVLASFCPKLPIKSDPLLLKILVDCSGSMRGDSIWQAKRALGDILNEVSPQDFISFSRFGSDVDHASRRMEPCSPEILEKISGLVTRSDADLGGTEMEKAILSTCRDISLPEKTIRRPALLLITDDLYWSNGGLLKEAVESGHRIFAIGVGSAPAECLLRQLAEKTGGACEFVTPNEDMAPTIVRMFRRMRAEKSNRLRIDWGSEPLWQSPLPLSIFDGDTLHQFAVFAEKPAQRPVLSWEADGKAVSDAPESFTMTDNHDLARLGAAQRLLTAESRDALELALKYQLVSAQTSLFLVYLRDGEDKATELPEIHQVPQMMARGFHNFGSVIGGLGVVSSSFAECCSFSTMMLPSLKSIFQKKMKASGDLDSQDISSAPKSPQELLEFFNEQALAHQDYAAVLELVQSFSGSDQVTSLVADFARQEGITLEQAWTVFLDWLMNHLANECPSSRHAKRLLHFQMKAFEHIRQAALQNYLNSQFSSISAGSWE